MLPAVLFLAAPALPPASSRCVIHFLLLCIPSSTHTLETDRVLYDVHSIKMSLMERLCGLCSRSRCHHSVSHPCCEGRCESFSCPSPWVSPTRSGKEQQPLGASGLPPGAGDSILQAELSATVRLRACLRGVGRGEVWR